MRDELDEVLDEAVEALRAHTDTPSNSAQGTRTRVLLSVHKKRRRFDRFAAAAAALLVLVGAPTVWAHFSGRLPLMMSALGFGDDGQDGPVFRERTSRTPQEENSPASVLDESSSHREEEGSPVERNEEEDAPVAPTLDSAEASPEAPRASQRRGRARAPQRPRTREDTAESSPEHALFSAAHRAHFGGASRAHVLAQWDAYLNAYGDGRFAPEARYNRALTLVRLGRLDDARAALAPFASGRYGATRQRDAHALIDAIDARSTSPNEADTADR